MFGFLLKDQECCELKFLLQKELEELLLDLNDHRIDKMVRKAMEDRYSVIFRIYSRMAAPKDLARYARHKAKAKNDF